MTKKKLRKELRKLVTAFCGGVETHSELFIDEIMDTIEDYSSTKASAVQPDVIKSVCDLDGKTIPVTFKVSKMKPNPNIEE